MFGKSELNHISLACIATKSLEICEGRRLRQQNSRGRDGGGSGIRTHGSLRISGFQDRCVKPLCHPSKLLIISNLSANSSPRIRLNSDLVASPCQIPGNMRTKANGTPRVANITV